ncbi:MAG: DUF1292 domain-containing protein [Lachnospiraceae bacterium]|nr:DUF1292 domain-containing protein [Lachnospiraceae bacterium]
MDKVEFQTEDGVTDFFILEQTRLNGHDYILVSEDANDEEALCVIMKAVSENDRGESIYEPVEDETELNALALVFEELLEDVDIE